MPNPPMVIEARDAMGGTGSGRRPSLRRALWRWLAGPEESEAAAPQVLAPPPPMAALPADQLQRQQGQAERCYAYAEQLNNQGSADLAVAFYRQAYVQLRGSLGLHGAPQGWQPALPAAAASLTQAPAAPSLAAPGATASPLAQQLQRIKERLNAGTAAELERELHRWLEAGHREADLLNLLGLAALLQERRPEAERWFRETLAANPDHLRALVNLGGLCLASDRSEEALQHLGRAVRLLPPRSTEGLVALTNLTLAHQNLGRPMDAAQLALRIFRIKPDHLRPESLSAAAATLEEMGEDAAAIEILQHLRGQGGSTELLRRLAKLLERRGDFQEAALVYRELLSQPDAQASPQQA